MALPRVLSVNVGAVREIEWRGEIVTTGIWKYPVDGRIAVRGVNLAGDDQADRSVHGGTDKAVYAYSIEDYQFWREHERFDAAIALFGENLTTSGLDLSSAVVGERWRVGSTVLEIAQPRLPCYKLGIRVGDPRFLKRFLAAQRMGAYLRIIEEGDLGAGDAIDVISTPEYRVTLRDLTQALRDPAKAHSLRRLPRLPAFWREVAESR